MLYRMLRRCYRWLPLPPAQKRALKDLVYERFGVLFENSFGYRAWRRARAGSALQRPLAPRAAPPSVAQWHALADRRRLGPGLGESGAPYVVVPVYGGRDVSLACLYSVLVADPSSSLVVIDDATPDPELADALDTLAALGLIELIRHRENRGFVSTANEGMQRYPERDVVLLNSDTLVFGNWIERLSSVLHSRSDLGSVTPLSNNGEICSYPEWLVDNDLALEIEDAELDRLAAQANRGEWVETPTGVGFCLMLRRECLADVGPFDLAFGLGYGEETDHAQRAVQQGWRHAIAGEVFVRHLGGESFGDRGAQLRERGEALLARRHPDYPERIREFQSRDPVRPLRRRLDLARCRRAAAGAIAAASGAEERVLLVSHDDGGGVARHVDEVEAELEAAGCAVYRLRPSRIEPGSLELAHRTMPSVHSTLQFDPSGGVDDTVSALAALDLDRVEVHHLGGLAAEAPRWWRTLAGRLARPFEFVVHDYSAVCPRVRLVGAENRYCGEPELDECERCVRSLGSPVGAVSVASWRSDWAEMLSDAERVVCPSHDTARRIERHFPALRPIVRPHPERHGVPGARPAGVGPRRGGPTRVAVVGAIGPEKGSEVLLACARDAAARGLPLAFCVVGYTDRDSDLVRSGVVTITGPYDDANLRSLLAEQDFDLAFQPSVWPETWCYALTAVLDVGLPAVVFDLGAQAERVCESKGGIQLPLDWSTKPARINRALLDAAARGRA